MMLFYYEDIPVFIGKQTDTLVMNLRRQASKTELLQTRSNLLMPVVQFMNSKRQNQRLNPVSFIFCPAASTR